jgi:peptidoglycan/LPS O-acetylase OafA/YrhL
VDVRSYALRRTARIVPAYYLAVIGACVLLATAGDAFGRRTVDLQDLPLFFAFLQNYFPQTAMKLDAATWTLVVEVAFYALIPLIALGLARRSRSSRAQLAVLVGLAARGSDGTS